MSLPQRILGRDLFWWLSLTRLMQLNVESRLGRRMAQRDTLIGSSERRLRRSGVTIRKRLVEAVGRRTVFEDGSALDVDVVVWATGYRPDYSWIDIPEAKDESGHIVHRRGVTPSPGFTFVGLTWQHTRGSALLGFVKEDAAFIAETIDTRRNSGTTESSPESGAELRSTTPRASGR